MISPLLILLGVYLNRGEQKLLLLTLLVGLSYFLPVELIHDRNSWYIACIASELFVLVSALLLKTRASLAIVAICVMLEMNHFIGWFFKGFLSGSPYHLVIQFLEYSELVSCSLFSFPVINKLKEIVCRVSR